MEVSIETYLSNLKTAINGLPAETDRLMVANMEQVIDLVREEQMLKKGINAEGKSLGLYRSNTFKTENWQDARGYPKMFGNRFNLLASGRFVNSMVLKKYRNKYKIKANIPYLNEILNKTNTTEDELMGLTKDNLVTLDEKIIKPKLDKWLLKIL